MSFEAELDTESRWVILSRVIPWDQFAELYSNLQKLLTALRIAQADGLYLKILNRIEKQDLIILGDNGLKPLDNNTCISLLELIKDRYGRCATIMSSQPFFNKWHDI